MLKAHQRLVPGRRPEPLAHHLGQRGVGEVSRRCSRTIQVPLGPTGRAHPRQAGVPTPVRSQRRPLVAREWGALSGKRRPHSHSRRGAGGRPGRRP